MFIFANLFFTLAKIIDIVVTLYIFVLIAHVVLSWIQYDQYNSIVRFINDITEPILMRIRRIIPPIGGMDFSPMVLIFALYILEGFVVNTLVDFGNVLR